MKIPALMESFRARLILLLALLLGLTLGVQYYVNLRAVKNNARYESANFQVAGDTVTWQGNIYIDPTAFGPDFPSPIESHYRARVQNGKITDYTIDNDAAWLARVPKALLPQTGGETTAPPVGVLIIGATVLLVLGWMLRRGYLRTTP